MTPERSITRKIKEFILSIEIERRYTKDQILEMYLNEAPYGGTLWGVETAAKGYFGKSTKDLTLIESAVLAGLPQRPSYYSPFIGKKDAYKSRTQAVLRRMREDRYISKNDEKEALDALQNISFSSSNAGISAPHFIFFIRDEVAKLFGEDVLDKGLKIQTTISLEVQKEAEKIVKEEIGKLKNLNATNGSVVVIDSQTGEILAMVGSYDYTNEEFGKYNTATALRQPGSSIKPVTYALAFEKGYTPATVVMDTKTIFPNQGGKDYIPENYDGKFRGAMQLRFALGNSINISAVKLLSMVGIRDFLGKAYDMGLTTLEPTARNLQRFGLAITLGGGEVRLVDLTSAYSVFARGGMRREYTGVREIKTFDGKTLTLPASPSEKRVLTPEVSFLISHILSDNNARSEVFGTRSYLNIPGKTVAVKTGTTDDKRDNWTVGYTKDVTVGVWVGNNDNSPMNPKIASGTTGASPIWYTMMTFLLKKYRDGIPDKPETVDAFEIDAYLGGTPRDPYPKRVEYFIKGTEPKTPSAFYKRLKISKNNGKLANELEVRLGEYEEKDFIVITEKDPISTDGINRFQQGIDEWVATQSDEKFRYPKEASDVKTDDIIVQIKEPGDHATVGNDIVLKASITSIQEVRKIEVKVGSDLVASFADNRSIIEEPLKLSDGVYTVSVWAENASGKTSDARITIGVNKPWDAVSPTPTPAP